MDFCILELLNKDVDRRTCFSIPLCIDGCRWGGAQVSMCCAGGARAAGAVGGQGARACVDWRKPIKWIRVRVHPCLVLFAAVRRRHLPPLIWEFQRNVFLKFGLNREKIKKKHNSSNKPGLIWHRSASISSFFNVLQRKFTPPATGKTSLCVSFLISASKERKHFKIPVKHFHHVRFRYYFLQTNRTCSWWWV